jgi:hypothetical protein
LAEIYPAREQFFSFFSCADKKRTKRNRRQGKVSSSLAGITPGVAELASLKQAATLVRNNAAREGLFQ